MSLHPTSRKILSVCLTYLSLQGCWGEMQVFPSTQDKVWSIYPPCKHVLSTCYVLGSSLGTGGTWG